MLKPISFCVGQYDSARFAPDLDACFSIEPRAHIRLDAVWRYCSDPTGTKYDFRSLDAKVAAVLSRGGRVRFQIPMWCPDKVLAGKPDKTQIKTPEALAGFIAFCKALGSHYGALVNGASTGNEPNLQFPFAPDGADPEWQAKVTNAIIPVLPTQWKLYTPGLAPAADKYDGPKPLSLSPLSYLRAYWAALNASSQARIHGVEIHPYGRAADVTQSWSVLGKLKVMHDLTGKPIDASEYNSDWKDSDAAKAVNVPKGLDYMAGLGFVERVFIYAMSDKTTDKDYHLGMLDGAGNRRPLFDTVGHWVKEH